MNAFGSIVTIARWQTRKEALGDVLRLVAELRQQSLAEPGCRGYEVFHDVEDPSVLLIIERYDDTVALDAHRNSDHYRQLVADRIIPLLDNRRVEILQPHAQSAER